MFVKISLKVSVCTSLTGFTGDIYPNLVRMPGFALDRPWKCHAISGESATVDVVVDRLGIAMDLVPVVAHDMIDRLPFPNQRADDPVKPLELLAQKTPLLQGNGEGSE